MKRACRFCVCRVQLYNKVTNENVLVEHMNIPYFIEPNEARGYIESKYEDHLCIQVTPIGLPTNGIVTMSNEAFLKYGVFEVRKTR